MPSYNSVAVIGAGAWGTALAGVAARAGREVVLYARDAARAAQIASSRSNPKLTGVRLDARIGVTSNQRIDRAGMQRTNDVAGVGRD